MNISSRGRWTSAALAVPVLVAITACAASEPAPSGGDGESALAPIVVGAAPAADITAPYVALEQGFFDEVGLDVTVETLAGGSALVPALESGSMQIGNVNLLSLLQGLEQGLDLTCLNGIFKGTDTQSVLLAPDAADEIRSGADLEGRTVAVNTLGNIAQLVVEAWAAEDGADPSRIEFVALGFAEHRAALESGQVDAALAAEPFNSQMKSAGLPVLEADPIAAIGDDPTFACWTAKRTWLDEHPREAQAWREAMLMVDEYLAENPDSLRQTVVTALNFPEADAETFTLPTISSEMSPDDFEIWMGPAVEYGFLRGDVDVSRAAELEE